LLLGLHFIVILRCLAAVQATTQATTIKATATKTTIIDNNNGNNNTRMPRAYLCLPCGMWSAAPAPATATALEPRSKIPLPSHSL